MMPGFKEAFVEGWEIAAAALGWMLGFAMPVVLLAAVGAAVVGAISALGRRV